MILFRMQGLKRLSLGLFAGALAGAVPAQGAMIVVEGTGTVTTVAARPGTSPTGTVVSGDTLSFRFVFNPENAPRLFDGGNTFQVFGPPVDEVDIAIGGYDLTLNPDPVAAPAVLLGTGFRTFTGETLSSAVFTQQFAFSALPGSDLPFAVGPTGSVSFSLTSTFRQDLEGAAPTLANLRDPREAAINRFDLTVRDGRTLIGFVEGNFTASFSAAAAVPEPGTWALLIVGFGAIGATMRTRRTRRVAHAV